VEQNWSLKLEPEVKMIGEFQPVWQLSLVISFGQLTIDYWLLTIDKQQR
jgi:hypothetical protein